MYHYFVTTAYLEYQEVNYAQLCRFSNVAMDRQENYLLHLLTTPVQLYCTIHGGIPTCTTNTMTSQSNGVACTRTTVIFTT